MEDCLSPWRFNLHIKIRGSVRMTSRVQACVTVRTCFECIMPICWSTNLRPFTHPDLDPGPETGTRGFL